MEEASWWNTYGCTLPNPRRTLPAPEYRAHLAILSGRAEKEHEEAEKARAANKR